MANTIIDGNLFKNIQTSIKRETEKFLGKNNGITIPTGDIREFVIDNQETMFKNGGKNWVINHFVDQVRNQQSSIVSSESPKKDIYIPNIYTSEAATSEEPKSDLPVHAPQQELSSVFDLPSEIITAVESKFSTHSQEVQQALVTHLQELKLESAIQLREKLDELANLEARLLNKILGDYRQKHQNTLSTLQQALTTAKSETLSQSENFTQEFHQRMRDIEKMFQL